MLLFEENQETILLSTRLFLRSRNKAKYKVIPEFDSNDVFD